MVVEIKYLSTYSIVAYDPDARDFGVAVASKFIAVGHVVPWVEVDVGAIATQSYANVRFGPEGLRLLKEGLKPREVVERLLSNDPRREERQLGIVDKREAYAYTGSKCIEWAGHIIGDHYAVQGNLLVGGNVLDEMAKAFENTRGELVDKLLAALEAGDRAGGDRRGKQSAALIVLRPCGGYGGCEEGVGRYVDIRVDDHPEPVLEVKRIFRLWELTLLEREDPSDVVKWDEVWRDINEALLKLGYINRIVDDPSDRGLWEAFEKWIGINNFENKMRRDGYIWGTIHRYLIEEARKQ